jgi:ABC-type transport system substrate-binding protein
MFSLLFLACRGNFELTYKRSVGANTDPDFFAFSFKRFPPDGAHRRHYRNPRIDALIDQIRVEMDQEKRKARSSEVQKILAEDLPYLRLRFNDVVAVHPSKAPRARVTRPKRYRSLSPRGERAICLGLLGG